MIKREDIIKPLIFLDIFDYPLTAMEIWRFLGVEAELGEVVIPTGAERSGGIPFSLTKGAVAEERDPSAGLGMTTKNGYHFLPGREALVEKRREFFHLSERKFKIAKRAAWLLHFIPSIKMIAVCNNFYYREQSDIDFFIITAANRLWLTRFFATIILDIFGLRARGEKTADKVCLSFYLSEDSMNLEWVALKNFCHSDRSGGIAFVLRESVVKEGKGSLRFGRDDKVDDPYLAYWLAFLEPIYGQECYNKFWEANAWLKNVFPNALPKIPVPRRCVGRAKPTPAFSHPSREGNKFFGNWLENVTKKIQWQKISPHVKEMATLNDNRVVINEVMLKFHENDRREEFREKFKEKINNLF